MRHGAEMHLIRPDRVGYTGVLTAIPGYQPAINAQEVAARFTAIWQPRVQDALQGYGLGERKPTIAERYQAWAARRRFKRLLRRMGMRDAAITAPVPSAPSFQRQEDAALAISMRAVSEGAHPFPPVLNPAANAAAGITPIAYAPEALSQQLVQARVGGMVGARANAMGLFPITSAQSPGWVWSRSY